MEADSEKIGRRVWEIGWSRSAAFGYTAIQSLRTLIIILFK